MRGGVQGCAHGIVPTPLWRRPRLHAGQHDHPARKAIEDRRALVRQDAHIDPDGSAPPKAPGADAGVAAGAGPDPTRKRSASPRHAAVRVTPRNV